MGPMTLRFSDLSFRRFFGAIRKRRGDIVAVDLV